MPKVYDALKIESAGLTLEVQAQLGDLGVGLPAGTNDIFISLEKRVIGENHQ